MIRAKLVTLGTRIPVDLKLIVSNYCDRNGVKLQFFIMEAIKEKLEELQQDAVDSAVVDQRMKNPQFSSKAEMEKYIQVRKRNV